MFPWHFLGKAWLQCELHGGRAGSGYRYIPGAARGAMLHISLWKVMCCWDHPFPPPILHHRLQTTYFSIAFNYLLKLPLRLHFHQCFWEEGAANLTVAPCMSQLYNHPFPPTTPGTNSGQGTWAAQELSWPYTLALTLWGCCGSLNHYKAFSFCPSHTSNAVDGESMRKGEHVFFPMTC